jgi:hypothetical protein
MTPWRWWEVLWAYGDPEMVRSRAVPRVPVDLRAQQ